MSARPFPRHAAMLVTEIHVTLVAMHETIQLLCRWGNVILKSS